METPPNELLASAGPAGSAEPREPESGSGGDAGLRSAPAAARPRNPALGLQGEALRKPSWLKVPLPGGEAHARLKSLVRDLGLHTVCEQARCPNIGECWKGEHATMTLMVLGDECTRRCRFCAVKTVLKAAPPDPLEPAKVGMAIAALNLGYVVLTSVDRDDLADGGSAHYAQCIAEVRAQSPRTVIETLAPDYRGSDLGTLMAARPDVFAHNVEVVSRLQRRIRDPRCSFERSLDTLRGAKTLDPNVFTKSSLMVGLGETWAEIEVSLRELRGADVDFLTVGQYLRPTAQHAPVHEYLTPERFFEIQKLGESLGFKYVASGPLVRSSYRAGEFFAARLVRERREAVRALANRNASPQTLP